jgi:hypothetical protein
MTGNPEAQRPTNEEFSAWLREVESDLPSEPVQGKTAPALSGRFLVLPPLATYEAAWASYESATRYALAARESVDEMRECTLATCALVARSREMLNLLHQSQIRTAMKIREPGSAVDIDTSLACRRPHPSQCA